MWLPLNVLIYNFNQWRIENGQLRTHRPPQDVGHFVQMTIQ